MLRAMKTAISFNMSISVSIAASRLTRSSEGGPSGAWRHSSGLLSVESQDQNSLSVIWCRQKEIQQQLSTAQIRTVYTYITWIHDKILDWPSSIPFINCLVLQLETYSYERRNLVKSLCEGFRRDTKSHHKAAKPLGLSAVAWSQSNTFYLPARGRRRTVAV
jgi:hypothetical protein